MKEEVIFSLDTPYRESCRIRAFSFGSGHKTCAVVAGIRGNEVQQMYVASLLVNKLRRLEEENGFLRDHQVLVIPCANPFSMNVNSRFWPMDQTDINRMFPGYDKGETTQRIADSIFQVVRKYEYGIHLASFYLPGDFIPHVRIMNTGYENAGLGNLFGLPFVVVSEPTPFDTTTLNYNWQIWDAKAFSVYTRETEMIDSQSAKMARNGILRFLNRVGCIRYPSSNGFLPTVVEEKKMLKIHTEHAGIFHRLRDPGDEVEEGESLAEILDPLTGDITDRIKAPAHGIVFFAMRQPLISIHEIAFRIITDLHS